MYFGLVLYLVFQDYVVSFYDEENQSDQWCPIYARQDVNTEHVTATCPTYFPD